MAAVLTAELGNAEKVSHFIAECEAMGLTVLGPDVNESRANFTPVGDKIRFGLAGVKGVGELAAQKIIEEREAHGPYADFADLVRRVDGRAINKRVLEHLVKTGAFDFSGAARKPLFDGIDAAIAGAAAHARDKAAGQHSFLDMLAGDPPPKNGNGKYSNGNATPPSGAPGRSALLTPPDSPTGDFTSNERLSFEKELLGFYVSGHPLNAYAGLTEAIDTFAVEQLLQQPDRTEFRLCGIASNLAKKLSKRDNRPWMAFTLATRQASLPLNMFADAFAAHGHHLAENALVLVQGNILVNQEGARINVKECYPLDGQVAALVRKVAWLLHPSHRDTTAFLRLLRETLNKQVGDTRVELGFLFAGRVAPFAEASHALSWKLNTTTFQELRAHPAVAGVLIETRPLELKQERRWARRS
jgi:DNA polymerase-3 subunit alpha